MRVSFGFKSTKTLKKISWILTLTDVLTDDFGQTNTNSIQLGS